MRLAHARLLTALCLLLALVAAGCGGGGGDEGASGQSAGAGSSGAALVPADSALFITANTDFESEQWQAVEALLARFPSGDKAINSILDSLSSEGVDYTTDIKPALGSEVAVAVLDFASAEKPPFVLVTKPTDPAKFEALLAKGDEKPVFTVEDGWYLVSDSQAVIDRALVGSRSSPLADSDSFKDAMGALPAEAVARLYLNGASLMKAFQAQPEARQFLGTLNFGGGTLTSAGMALTAEPQGVRLEGVAKSEGAPEVATYSPELPAAVPAGSLAYISFHGLADGLGKFLGAIGEQSPEFDQQLGQVELLLGVSLRDDVLPLFANEGAIYVRPGAPIPEITLLLEVDDEQKALATLDKLALGIGAFAGSSFTPVPIDIAGVSAKQIEVSDQISVFYAAFDGRLVLTTAAKGIADLKAGTGTLADDALFREAREAAGMPDETLGFVYIDLEQGISLLDTFRAFDGADPEVRSNLTPLSYLLLYGSGGGNETRFAGFLGIK